MHARQPSKRPSYVDNADIRVVKGSFEAYNASDPAHQQKGYELIKFGLFADHKKTQMDIQTTALELQKKAQAKQRKPKKVKIDLTDSEAQSNTIDLTGDEAKSMRIDLPSLDIDQFNVAPEITTPPSSTTFSYETLDRFLTDINETSSNNNQKLRF